MLFDPQLNEAKQLIDVGDEESAKAIVVPYLQKNPQSPDAWWLFAILTDTDADEELALKRALEIDPFHYEAKRALERLQAKRGSVPSVSSGTETQKAPDTTSSSQGYASTERPKPTMGSFEVKAESVGQPTEFPFDTPARSKTTAGKPVSESAGRVVKFGQTTPNAMEAVARAYSTYGWTATQYSPKRTVMEKKTGISWFWAFVWLIIPIVGLTMLAANFLIRRTYTIIITSQDKDRKLRFEGNVKTVTLDQDAILAGRVAVPTPEINTNYLTAILIGGVAALVILCGLCVGIALIFGEADDGSDADTTSGFDIGDTAFVLSDETKCIDVHRLPGNGSTIFMQFPKGEQVSINLRVERDDLDEVWYEVRSMTTGLTGWLPASNVGNELDNVSLPPRPCN